MTEATWTAALVVCCWASVACDSSRSEARATDPAPLPAAPAAAPIAPAAAAPTPAAQQRYREAEFSVALEGPASGKAGETLALQVILEAADGYKVNQEYPIKFQINKAEGVVPEKETVLKADAIFDGHRATLPVKVKLQGQGPHQLGGRLSFSVCKQGDASVCLLEKRELSMSLDAS
jgi:hypothetical protein